MSDTCWASTVRTAVLCLQDPWSRRLARFTVDDGPVPKVAAPRQPMPLGLQLADGLDCRLRDGGAWGILPQHPDWTGAYYCQRNGHPAPELVYGPTQSPIDKTRPQWTVQVTTSMRAPVTVGVLTAYYVATAP